MMRREVEVYAERPDPVRDPGRWACGSGYLLAGRRVLTAAHVVCLDGQPLPTVRIRAESGDLVAATVVWHRYDERVDAALLEVTDTGWVCPGWRHRVRFGWFVTGWAGQRCEAVGFPQVVATPVRRDSHHAVGVVNPKSLIKAARYAVEVVNPPAAPNMQGSRWAGMSGAAVRCEDLLVGVATEDPAQLGELGPVLDWCADPAWFGMRLITGTGGQGKTRLARHLVGQLPQRAGDRSASGWAAVVLGVHPGRDELAVLAEATVPTLVVVDYAESRGEQLDPLVAALHRAEAKVRLLLLARTAGAWRTERVTPAPHLAVLADDRIVVPLTALEAQVTRREQAWRQAVAALAPRLGELDGYRHVPWSTIAAEVAPPELGGERFRTILTVQMNALAALLHTGDPATVHAERSVERDARKVLLAHEHRYWARVAERFQITLSPATQRCLVAAATLWGAADVEDARRLVAAALPGKDPDAVGAVAEWLATLYRDAERYWSGLQPDPLAEYLLATTLGAGRPCADLAGGTRSAASVGQLEHALTILGRAHPQHPHLTATITDLVVSTGTAGGRAAIAVAPRLEQPQPVLAALDRIVDGADLPALHELSGALPRFSLLLGPTIFKIQTAIVAALRLAAQTNPDAHLPDLAASVNNLANRLAEAGRRAEGLAAAQEAVDLRRELAAGNRDAYLPDLATSVNNLAIHLAEAGRRAEGLAAAQEAVDLYRELAAGEPHLYGPTAERVGELVAFLTRDEP